MRTGAAVMKFHVSLHVKATHRRHVAWFHTHKIKQNMFRSDWKCSPVHTHRLNQSKMDIFLINITMWSLYFPKVGEWITRRGAVGAKKNRPEAEGFLNPPRAEWCANCVKRHTPWFSYPPTHLIWEIIWICEKSACSWKRQHFSTPAATQLNGRYGDTTTFIYLRRCPSPRARQTQNNSPLKMHTNRPWSKVSI